MPKRNVILALALLVLAGALVWYSRRPATSSEPLQGVLDTIKREHVRPVDEDDVRRGAIEGMVSRLDPFSRYIPPGKIDTLAHRLEGKERGLGLRLEIADSRVMVVGPVRGSPADLAGICTGDQIVAVDGEEVAGLSLLEVNERLYGPAGSAVKLALFRADGREETLELTRKEFPIETLVGLYRGPAKTWVHLVDDEKDVMYVHVREFVHDTASKLQECLGRRSRFHAIVLDLRDNPGGPLESAVAVANLFLHTGTIVSVHARKKPAETYEASADGTYPRKIPVIVLVNDQTASAAEIVCGALQRQDRAVLVGTRTHGKGSIQRLLQFGELGQINLTVAEFRVGGMEVISRRKGATKWGVDPHEQVAILPTFLPRLRRLRLEAEVFRAPPGTREVAPTAGPASARRRLMELDLQLARAMEILRTPRRYDEIIRRAAAARAAQESAPPHTIQS